MIDVTREIERLAYLYGRGLDARSEADSRRYLSLCLAEEVEIVYSFGAWTGLERTIANTLSNMLRVFTFTQHMVSGGLIDVAGETAQASFRCLAAHGVATDRGQVVVMGGVTYQMDCRLLEQGWRIQSLVGQDSWMDCGDVRIQPFRFD
jgi:hypothetical protein